MIEEPIFAQQVECPSCPSLVTGISYSSGRLSIHHHDPFGEHCVATMKRLMTEEAERDGLIPILRVFDPNR
jgi:hypothetical protein